MTFLPYLLKERGVCILTTFLCDAYLSLRRWWPANWSCCPSQRWCWWCTAYPASGPSGRETRSSPGFPPRPCGRPQTRRRLWKRRAWPGGASTSASAGFPSPRRPSVPWERRALIIRESETAVLVTVFVELSLNGHFSHVAHFCKLLLIDIKSG